MEAGEPVRLSFFVKNSGEQLPTPFNTTIEVVQGDERTLVGRSSFVSMDANTAKSVKRSFTAPEGEWSLEITVDKEGLVWEIDETNNAWNQSFEVQASGLGAMTVALGGGGVLVLVGVGVLLRRRAPSNEFETKVSEALQATAQQPVSDGATPAPEPVKKRGPPGGKVATRSTKAPTRGPPRGPPRATSNEPKETPQEQAAKHMAALGLPSVVEERVEDYSKLPGGGDYEYTADGTYYVGPTCGRWRLNDDKSFTRLPDES